MNSIPPPQSIEHLPPEEIIYLAANMMEAHRQAMYELRMIRQRAVQKLYREGCSYGEIGSRVGLSRMQVHRIATQGAPISPDSGRVFVLDGDEGQWMKRKDVL